KVLASKRRSLPSFLVNLPTKLPPTAPTPQPSDSPAAPASPSRPVVASQPAAKAQPAVYRRVADMIVRRGGFAMVSTASTNTRVGQASEVPRVPFIFNTVNLADCQVLAAEDLTLLACLPHVGRLILQNSNTSDELLSRLDLADLDYLDLT